MSVIEKRRLERFSLKLPARLFVVDENQDKETIDLVTSDICSGGAFVETHQRLPVGTEVKIDLILPLDELKKELEKLKGRKTLIKVSGAVIRSNERGLAICFDERFRILPIRE